MVKHTIFLLRVNDVNADKMLIQLCLVTYLTKNNQDRDIDEKNTQIDHKLFFFIFSITFKTRNKVYKIQLIENFLSS